MLALAVLGVTVAVPRKPWQMAIPTAAGGPTGDQLIYPAGAVSYLRQQGFHGNLVTPFVEGAYVSWELWPNVKVSLDSRFDVAYPDGLLEEHEWFYRMEEGWQEFLSRYPSDAVLLRRTAAVVRGLASLPDWAVVYQDDSYAIVANVRFGLPFVDRTGEPIPATFP